MEYDTPSRFIRDFDPTLLRVEGNLEGGFRSHDDGRKPWQRPSEGPEWMQNPRPVATQFRADPKPRQIPVRKPEPAVNPFSASFERQLNMASNGRFKPVSRVAPAASAVSQPVSLTEGATIEHQRFGIGKVIKIEGTGDNEKATVEFRNAGTKQLLLKFAKFRIV
jgi:DNA helicase-2/ATP-dependent DNA helicase PcrA